MSSVMEILKELHCRHGAPGSEEDIRAAIQERIAPFADDVQTDALGNLIVHKKGSGARLLFTAHMDSTGFAVTHIHPDGFLHFAPLGALSEEKVCQAVVRFQNGTRGILAAPEKYDGKLDFGQMLIDIGARSEAEAKKYVNVGDTAIFDGPVLESENRILAPHLDNRASCAALLLAAEMIQKSGNDLYFAFTVQGKLGCRGTKTAAYGVNPDYAVALNTTASADTDSTKKNSTAKLGGGAAVQILHHAAVCHPETIKMLEDIGGVKGIPLQRDIWPGGSGEVEILQRTREGCIAGGIAIPCRYRSSPSEMADCSDIESAARLIAAYSETALERRLSCYP